MAALHTKLAAVMEAMVHAAVAELKKLVDGGSFCPDKLPSDTWETMVRVVPESEPPELRGELLLTLFPFDCKFSRCISETWCS